MNSNICFNCGSDLDRSLSYCPFCGAPEIKADSPKMRKLLSSAFALLGKSEFDKAKNAFEAILKKDYETAHTYWGRLRARYHISYVRAVGEKMVPRSATRSAAKLAEDIDYLWASFYADKQMKAFLKKHAEYLHTFCIAPEVGASKNITHQFTMGEVELNDEAEVKRKKPKYTLKFRENADGTYSVIGMETQNQTITNVEIPFSYNGKDVTGIDASVFKDCTGLTSITIPDSVTDIGNEAFLGCIDLMRITVPDGVTSIGDGAFSGCTGLMSIDIPDGVTSIGNEAFCNCGSLTGITIPDSVTSIGDSAFRGCSSLTSLEIPEGVTSIGFEICKDCNSLESLALPFVENTKDGESNTHLGYIFGAQSYSSQKPYIPTSLQTVVIADGTTSIPSHAFSDCTGLTGISIPESVTDIGDEAFCGCTALTGVSIPESVTGIGDKAFCDCTGLTSISIPSSVTSIGNAVFNGCSGLASITISEGVKSIDAGAFSDCSSLTSITVPEGVTSIGNNAFSFCSRLTGISIPDSLTSIGRAAFRNCISLMSISIPDGVTSIGEKAFSGCSNLPGTVYENAVYLGNETNPYFYLWKTDNNQITSFHIHESTKIIGYYAFRDCHSLTDISIPDSVTSVGASAFEGCRSLTGISIPGGVTSIGEYAFNGCLSLTGISIPEGVTSIGEKAFSGCKVLTAITFGGTKAQWNAINFGYYWNSNTGNYTVTCTDGTLSK